MSDQPQIPPKITIPSANSSTHPNTTPHPTSHPSNFPETPLIDTLTRKKRQQIYSIIGGLQSGIRSCHQQAQNMQRQLNSLQAALGIDVEDEDNIAAVEKA
jgi:Spy/CpxP family protein refolding chaperone